MLFGVGHVGRQMIAGNPVVGGATLDLSFMTPGTLDPRISFTRASAGTYFDSSGVMQNAGLNLLLWSQDVTQAVWTKLGAPTITGGAVAPDGTTTAQTISISPGNTFYQIATVASGARGEPSFWINPITTSGILNVENPANAGFGHWNVNLAMLSPGWQRITRNHPAVTVTVEFTGAPNGGMYIYSASGTISASFWGWQFEVGTVSTAYAFTTTAQNSAPRWDYDPVTHALRGLLIEEARTNLQFPSVNWLANATASASVDGVVQNNALAPDGTTTAMKLIPSGAATVHQWFTSFAGALNTTYTHSVYVKAAGYNYVYIELANTAFGANTQAGNFDLTNGTVASGSSASATIQSVGNGWFRLAVTATSLGTTGNYIPNLRVYDTLAHLTSGSSYAGDMVSGVLAWGKDVEVGAFPTSYIPTTAAAVTRAVDIANIPPANMGFYVSPGGSWMTEFIDSGAPLGTNQRVVMIPPGPGSLTPVFVTTNLSGAQYNGTAAVNTANPITAGQVSKVATTATASNQQVCTNGGAVASGVVATGYPTAGSSGIQFMCVNSATPENMTGYLRRVRYWPRVLSASELQQVTT